MALLIFRRTMRSAQGRASHLSVNLAFLRDICLYLQANHIGMYRMHSNVIPAGLHADPDALARQVGRVPRPTGATQPIDSAVADCG